MRRYEDIRALFERGPRAPHRKQPVTLRALAQYTLQKKIGDGAHGSVYLAHDRQLGRRVALKLIRRGLFDGHWKERFLREARCAAAITHPHIATLYEVGSCQRIDFMVLEYVPGKTLDRLIPARGMPLEQWLEMADQMTSALAALHKADIIHRDIKPGNFAVTKEGIVKLLDFGIAKPLHAAPGGHLTHDGTIKGTPAYMAPEQVLGRHVNARADIFSLGAVFYEMLGGRSPFKQDSWLGSMNAVLHDDPPLLLEKIPQELADILHRCLEKTPARRFHSAMELAEALGQWRRMRMKGRHAPDSSRLPCL